MIENRMTYPCIALMTTACLAIDLKCAKVNVIRCFSRFFGGSHHGKIPGALSFSSSILSVSTDPEIVQTVLNHGAAAYVVKSVNPIDLSSALRQALDGTVFSAVGLPEKRAQDDAVKAAGLTERETAILKALASGLSNKAIAK